MSDLQTKAQKQLRKKNSGIERREHKPTSSQDYRKDLPDKKG